LLTLSLLVEPFSGADASDRRETLTYGCDEVVLVGRITTVSEIDASQPGDILGRSRYEMKVRVKQVLRGPERRQIVPLVEIAHNQMRSDVDFWMILTKRADGAYVMRSANVTSIPYKLAPHCG